MHYRIPVELGGSGASIRELFYVLIRLAEADPDVAHSLRAHFSHVEEFLRNPDSEQDVMRGSKNCRMETLSVMLLQRFHPKMLGNLEFETTYPRMVMVTD